MNLQPLKQIKRYCVWCMTGQIYEVAKCVSTECEFYPLRFGKGVKGISNLKTIRKKCKDCCGYEDYVNRIRDCEFDGKKEEL